METRSEQLFEAAKKYIPGGVNSPVRAFGSVGRTPRFIASARGDRIVDVDGNEMIDYICSWGPGILGHTHPRVIRKVQEACEDGLTYGAPTEKEVQLAELIAGHGGEPAGQFRDGGGDERGPCRQGIYKTGQDH